MVNICFCLLLINSAAAFTCNVSPLCIALFCIAMLAGAAIVICIQSKYTAGGREISREGRFIHGGVEGEVLLEGHSILVL